MAKLEVMDKLEGTAELDVILAETVAWFDAEDVAKNAALLMALLVATLMMQLLAKNASEDTALVAIKKLELLALVLLAIWHCGRALLRRATGWRCWLVLALMLGAAGGYVVVRTEYSGGACVSRGGVFDTQRFVIQPLDVRNQWLDDETSSNGWPLIKSLWTFESARIIEAYEHVNLVVFTMQAFLFICLTWWCWWICCGEN